MPHFNTVVFDLDGTLLDTSEGILSSVLYTIKQFGFAELDRKEYRKFIGPPIQDSFARQYGLQGPILQEIATVFRDHYKNIDLLKAKPYEGIYDVLKALLANNQKPVVATYKRQDYATQILEHFGFHEYMFAMCGADHENKLKKKDIIKNSIDIAGESDFSKVVMVGDSDNDAIGALGLGVNFIGVTYGFGFKNQEDVKSYQHYGIADTTAELKSILIGE